MQLPQLPPRPAVSVVVAARDAARLLPRALRSAVEQDHSIVDVVIAVGPSSDGTRAVAEGFARDVHAGGSDAPAVLVIDNPAGSTPAGLNAAIAASHGEVVVRLDAQAKFPPGYVARAVELLRETGAANVGGLQVPVAEDGFAASVAAAMGSWFGAGGARYRVGGAPGNVETVYLGVFRRAALDAVGGFDPRLERNQDYELNHRLRAAGGRVYFHPDLAVEYTPRGSVGALWRQYHAYGSWKRQVVVMHPRSLRWRQLAPPLLVVAVVATGAAAVASGVTAPFVVVVGTYTAALATAATMAARRPALAPGTAAALFVMHAAWGIGFLVGGLRRGGRRRPADSSGAGPLR